MHGATKEELATHYRQCPGAALGGLRLTLCGLVAWPSRRLRRTAGREERKGRPRRMLAPRRVMDEPSRILRNRGQDRISPTNGNTADRQITGPIPG
ncbi:MAG: hypothetical protein AW12_01173 [Candidatus Accumulibacter sp. BA-94]|nr:MAG: hypothetical protein AW12_01173 [Candidatus Accumulibacter sp. BA-94]